MRRKRPVKFTKDLNVRVTEGQMRLVTRMAQATKQTASQFVRSCLRLDRSTYHDSFRCRLIESVDPGDWDEAAVQLLESMRDRGRVTDDEAIRYAVEVGLAHIKDIYVNPVVRAIELEVLRKNNRI